jgi:hypothetical protein
VHEPGWIRSRAAGRVARCLIVLVASCGDEATPVSIADLPDGSYLRGVQISRLVIDPGLEVVRTELFLDGLRIAADDFAPFELGWDTREFEEGSHALAARVYMTSGEHVDGSVGIWIDNTPPTIGTIAPVAGGPQSFVLDVSDNLKLAQVEVTTDTPGESPVVITRPPFSFPWTWGCGKTTLRIRAIDAAGAEASATGEVTAVDAADRDCDGFRGTSTGGADCDEDNAMIHPGAAEAPEGFDLNCDGVVASLGGVDFDGDGVPSVSDGGSDCNDLDPAVHGEHYRFARDALTVDGVPVTWSPGEAVLDDDAFRWTLYLNRGGVIEQVTPGFTGEVLVRPVATGANPASISAGAGLVGFGRGNDLVVLRQGPTDWVEHVVIHASNQVGKLVVGQMFANGSTTQYAAFQAGTDLWLATSSDGSGWTATHIDDLRAPLVQNPAGLAHSSYAAFAVRTNQGAWTYRRTELNQPFQSVRHGPVDRAPTVVTTGLSPELLMVAVDDGAGSAVYLGQSPQPLLRTPKRVTAMAARFPSIFVQFDDGLLQTFVLSRFSTHLRNTQTITDIGRFDTAAFNGFAGSGFVHYIVQGTVFAPNDPFDDLVDRDCNERD